MKYPSLLRRLILSQIIAMVIACLLVFCWLIFHWFAFENGDLDRRMLYFAHTLAEASSAAPDNPRELERRLKTAEKLFIDGQALITHDKGSHYTPLYQVWDRAGRLIYKTANAPDQPIAGTGDVFMEKHWGGSSWRTVAAISGDSAIEVHIAERGDRRVATSLPMLTDIALSQVLILAWCAAVMLWTAYKGFHPLRMLAIQIAKRKTGDFSPIYSSRLYAETAPILEELNALLGREGTRLDNERRFLADAAHELRTPLAAINAQAHLLVNAQKIEHQRLAASELQQDIDRVSHLLTQLLTIARVDAEPTLVDREMIDIASLSRERLASLSSIARSRLINLSLDAPETLLFAVNRAGFISILDNLVDNAIRYTASSGHVEVRIVRFSKHLELSVCDDGPGILPAERERIFERFYRIPGTTQQGSGLGLAIVRRIAQSHGATIQWCAGLHGRGIGVIVSIPVAKLIT
ncbi:ATP-binding protein [uncultured Castellaniella sp.]|uniref:ATP-binding protein n=1 Tax=uncultured Castellaniella sp. TaxID=647907 RepID=UPI00261A1CAD|nr:ATP-binding protein [uncultured Castellaniella sp.]